MREAETLVLLDPDPPPGLEDRIRARYRITQAVSPRIFVLERPDDAEALRQLTGVRGVFDDVIPTSVLAELDEGESLFVQAWSNRESMKTKRRPGEGLDWDAPGRLPPDPPRHRSGSSQNQEG